jgi:hypothetical protein
LFFGKEDGENQGGEKSAKDKKIIKKVNTNSEDCSCQTEQTKEEFAKLAKGNIK